MNFLAHAMGGFGGKEGGESGGFGAFLPLILMFAIFYFLLIRPQQKKAKAHKQLLASIKKGDLHITISTNGKSPMLSRKIRKELECMYNDEYALFLDALGKLRKQVLIDIDDIQMRKEIFGKIVYSNLLEKYQNEEVHDIEKEVMNYYEQMKKVMKK